MIQMVAITISNFKLITFCRRLYVSGVFKNLIKLTTSKMKKDTHFAFCEGLFDIHMMQYLHHYRVELLMMKS